MQPLSPPSADESISPDVAALERRVDALRGSTCQECARTLCGHEALFCIALGCSDRPRCRHCLARTLGRDVEAMRDHLYEHFQRRDCYGAVWNRESQRPGCARPDSDPDSDSPRPACLWPVADSDPRGPSAPAVRSASLRASTADPPSAPLAIERPGVDERWDAGALGCGELVLELRRRLKALPPGAVLELVALDPGAPADLPAWCGLTGHRLIDVQSPVYWIQRKDD